MATQAMQGSATQPLVKSEGASLIAMLGAAALGLMVVFFAGHAQSAVLHDAAHDTRHATGFPCH